MGTALFGPATVYFLKSAKGGTLENMDHKQQQSYLGFSWHNKMNVLKCLRRKKEELVISSAVCSRYSESTRFFPLPCQNVPVSTSETKHEGFVPLI